jgi:hypothetical protein
MPGHSFAEFEALLAGPQEAALLRAVQAHPSV